MGLDRKLKKRIEQIDKNLDAIVKNPYEKVVTEPASEPAPAWARWVFPIGGAFLSACFALSIVLPLALTGKGVAEPASTVSSHNSGHEKGMTDSTPTMMGGGPNDYGHYQQGTYTPETLNCLIAANHGATKGNVGNDGSMSETTYNSYKAFTKKFVTLAMNKNNAAGEKSTAISIPDAYLTLAITGIISDSDGLQDVLDYLELENAQTLSAACVQIISTLGSMKKDQFGNDVGGLSLNSIWLNPQKMALLQEKNEGLYRELKNTFDSSLYLEGLTSNRAKQFIAENGLPGKPVPNIEFSNDNDPAALSVMSTYYNIDVFGYEQGYYQNEYLGGQHTIDYTFGGKTKKVDYIDRTSLGSCIYENEAFSGATMRMSESNISFFLPKSRTLMPSAILEEVLDEDYSPKALRYTEGGEEKSTTFYPVNISAPYFFLENKTALEREDLVTSFPHLTYGGVGSRLANSLVSENVFLSSVEQFSVMRFDYNGFYSCSATTASAETSADMNNIQEFVLDHPYVFRTSKEVLIGSERRDVPTVIGEIVDPNYLI